MQQALAEFAKYLFAKSDPMLAFAVLLLGYWIYKTNRKIDGHMDPDFKRNPSPHPQCIVHAERLGDLSAQMNSNHEETRRIVEKSRDMTRDDIAGLSERIDTALKIAVKVKE